MYFPNANSILKDVQVTADALAAIAVIAGIVWIVCECRKIRLLYQEEEHQTQQVKEELLKANDELFSPNNGCSEDEEERYKSSYCSICRQPLSADTNVSTSSKQLVSENSPLMESKKRLPALLTLRCGHEFHKKCITYWMAAERRNCDPCRCPVCLQAL